MKMSQVKMVRVYLTEGEGELNRLLSKLRGDEKVRGVTVFRGISGFGPSGAMHVSNLTDLSLDLPLVVEFFDTAEKVDSILEHLDDQLKAGHVVTWLAEMKA